MSALSYSISYVFISSTQAQCSIGVQRASKPTSLVPPNLPRHDSPATPTDPHVTFGLKVIGLVFAGFAGGGSNLSKPPRDGVENG